jgi:dynein heavy chain
MRAVKSVITAAGNLKRARPAEAEDVLLLAALRDVNVPKFLRHDLPLFDGIIADLFPGVDKPKVRLQDCAPCVLHAVLPRTHAVKTQLALLLQADNADLLAAMQSACAELGLQPVQPLLDKVRAPASLARLVCKACMFWTAAADRVRRTTVHAALVTPPRQVLQLYETTLVRHGLMLVGPTMAGKTCCYRVLAKALSALHAAGHRGFDKVC